MLIEDTANDYSKYVKVDISSELREVQDTIEDMLTRLDEFENSVNMVKTDGELCADVTVPSFVFSQEELDALCERVDKLEKLVGVAKCDLDKLQSLVIEAEAELSKPGGRMKKIKELFFKKPTTEMSARRHHRHQIITEDPTLFAVTRFFPPPKDDVEDRKSSS